MHRGLIVGALLLLGAAPAAAQRSAADATALSVERFTPTPGHASFGAVEEADVLPAWRWSVALWSSLMTRPIVLRDLITGQEATEPVRWRWGFEAHAALGLGRRYQLGVAVPWAAQTGDRLRHTGLDDARLQRLVLGDVRLHGRARITGRPGARGLGAALAGALVLPTGDDQHFAGEAGAVVEWKLAVGWRGAGGALAGNLGLRVRSEEVVLLSPARPHGNELVGGVAGELALPWLARILTVPDAAAISELAWVTGDSIGAGARGPSPAEIRAGLRLGVADGWAVTGLGGGGITPDDVGSPAWRIALGVIHDRAPLTDRDGDGVVDAHDRCRRDREDRDGVDDRDGCPDLDDDGDGIPDLADACPGTAEDPDGWRDGDGCPDDELRVPPMPDPTLGPPPLAEWLGLDPPPPAPASQPSAPLPPEPAN